MIDDRAGRPDPVIGYYPPTLSDLPEAKRMAFLRQVGKCLIEGETPPTLEQFLAQAQPSSPASAPTAPKPDPLDALIRDIDALDAPAHSSFLVDTGLAERYLAEAKARAAGQAAGDGILNDTYWSCSECDILYLADTQSDGDCPLCRSQHQNRLDRQQIDARGKVILAQRRHLKTAAVYTTLTTFFSLGVLAIAFLIATMPRR